MLLGGLQIFYAKEPSWLLMGTSASPAKKVPCML